MCCYCRHCLRQRNAITVQPSQACSPNQTEWIGMRLVILRSLCDGISTNSYGGNALNCPSHSDPKRHWDIAMSLSSWDHFLMDYPPTPMSHTNIYNGVSIPTSINTKVSLVAIQLPMQFILTLQPTNQRKGCFKIPHSPVVGRPTRWSLLFIFGFLIWSSSW